MPISQASYFGYDNLVAALEPHAYVYTMEVGACRHERGWLKLNLIPRPTSYGAIVLPPGQERPSREQYTQLRSDLFSQAQHAITILEAAGFEHYREPSIEMRGDSHGQVECLVTCEGTMPK